MTLFLHQPNKKVCADFVSTSLGYGDQSGTNFLFLLFYSTSTFTTFRLSLFPNDNCLSIAADTLYF